MHRSTKTTIVSLAILFILGVVQAYAEKLSESDYGAGHESIFDLEQEILSIPDSHEKPEPYLWNATLNPKEFEFSLARNSDGQFHVKIMPPNEINIQEIHVFVTNKKLEFAHHIIPEAAGPNTFEFDYLATQKDKYRFETIVKTEKGWINFREDMKLNQEAEKTPQIGPDYEILIKTAPAKAYSDHVTTFIYEISHKGEPIRDLQKMGGVDMHLFSWNSAWLFSLKEFNYRVPKQNFGGPEVAVSLVFKTPGRQVVFGEFSHLGKKRTVRYELNVASEN
jgi:hypothetical protein